jgi:hypothetical protein
MNHVMSEARTNLASTTRLAPETIRIRDALIEKFSDKPIEELNSFIARALDTETDEFKRLGLLAARVYILRQRVLGLKAFIRDDTMETLPEIDLTLTSCQIPMLMMKTIFSTKKLALKTGTLSE